jgi:hypothetical protein
MQIMSQLQKDLQEVLERIQEFFQEHQEVGSFSIVTTKTSTMTKIPLVSSPSVDTPQEKLGEFEKNTIGIGSNLLK